MTDLLHYLVMHLGGVKQDGYDDRKDILSPHYNSKRKRLLRKEIDYNKIIHLRKDERRIKE